MKKQFLLLAALPIALAASSASATVLVDETNTPNAGTNYSFNIFAGTASTSLSFAGYQVPSFSNVTAISLSALGSSTNLLAQTWTFAPAGCGSLAGQGGDGQGTGTNGVSFGGVCAGSYDTFAQNFASVAGQQYVLNFRYNNDTGPSGFRVETSAALANAVPEPATWLLMFLGFGAVGAGMRQRKSTVRVRFA